MTTTAECPACGRPQVHGILDHACTTALERDLGDVPAIVNELHTTLARQARIGAAGRSTAPARERWAYHPGASATLDDLTNTLTTWARDIRPDAAGKGHPAVVAARALLAGIDDIRSHPAAAELVDEVHNAVATARHAIDRPANRTVIFVGPCPESDVDGECVGEVYAFIPTEDDRPSRMECRYNKEHSWSSIQWYRTGKRIMDTIERRKREARA